MTGLAAYLIAAPFVLAALAAAATWWLVGRKGAPLGSRRNKP